MEDEILLPASCRCCLMEDKDMVYVFDILDEFDMKICDLITRNGTIVIRENDAFSKHICGNCLNDLAIAERFVLRCRKTNDLLMNLITSVAQEDASELIVNEELFSEAGDENVSYLLVAPEKESDLFSETAIAEEQPMEQVDDGPLNGTQTLLQPQHQPVGPTEEVETVEKLPVVPDSDSLNGDVSFTPEDKVSFTDGLYAEIFEDGYLKTSDYEMIKIFDDANEEDGIEEPENREISSMKIFDFKYSCDHCGASFVTLKHYARHLQLHNILACEKCLEIFQSAEIKESHQQLCTREAENLPESNPGKQNSPLASVAPGSPQQKKPYICSYCNKRWISQSALTIHLRTHTGERPFACRLCEKRFKTLPALELHERRHTGTKPFSCSMCDKRFTEGSNLKVHMLKHTNEKSHVCTVCGRAFSRVFLLQLHMRTHTGEKPYGCEVCGRRFAQQCDLTVHRRVHSGDRPYVCDECGKSYIKNSALAQHRKSHQKHLLKSTEEQLTDSN